MERLVIFPTALRAAGRGNEKDFGGEPDTLGVRLTFKPSEDQAREEAVIFRNPEDP